MNESRPLGELLRPALDDAQVERIWRTVESRRRRPAWPLALLPLAACAVVALWGLGRARPAPTTVTPGPLRLADGQSLAPAALRGRFALSDASRIQLSPGARATLQANSGSAFELRLTEGSARFEVTPGGPRRWRIDCELATVTVIGTTFTLDRRTDYLRVSVEHGRVWVDGPRVPGLHQALTAGQSFTLDARTESPAAEALRLTPGELPTSRARPRPTPPAEWRERAAAGDPQGAWTVLGDQGFAQTAREANPDTLLALADVARRTRRHALATPLLVRVVDDHPRHPEAAMAAYTLGRDALALRRDAPQASHWFERALGLQPPRVLEEDIRARLVESRGAAGDRAGACTAARDLAARFPSSARLATLQRWCE